jgi:hypothetical protein
MDDYDDQTDTMDDYDDQQDAMSNHRAHSRKGPTQDGSALHVMLLLENLV